MIKLKKTTKYVAFFIACLFVICAALPFGVSAADELQSLSTNALADGIYNISNVSSGKNLEAFDYKFDAQGRMHLDGRRYVAAQDFAIISHEDGTYSICPQNDGANYMLSAPENASEFSQMAKANANDISTRFYITKNANGTYRISPAADTKLSLAESSHQFAHYYYNVCELQKNSDSAAQQWKLEITDKKINVSISLNKDHDTVREYSINQLYAVVTPAAYSEKVVWTSSNNKTALVDKQGRYCAFSTGETVITATLGEVSVSCKVTVTDKVAFAWYSQCNMYTGGWNAAALKNVYFYAGGYYKPFMIDGFNGKADWMDEGCALSCAAMVLRNMNAKMEDGFDFRSGQNGNLEADPYTCALANSYNDGKKIQGSGTLYNDPILTCMSVITGRFNVDGKDIVPSTYYYVNKKMIKEQLDLHPEGVIIGMESSYYGSHYIVITGCVNPDAENPNDYEFIVCDPAAYDAKDGNNVPFKQSTSYKNLGYNYWHMWTMTTYDVVD